jgi:acetyl esterase
MNSPFKRIATAMTLSTLAGLAAGASQAAEAFAVTLDPAEHGRYQIHPPLPADGKLPSGTVVTVFAQPDAGYTLDGGYFSTPGPWGPMYHESMTPTFKVVVNQAMHIGASFIAESAVAHVTVKQDIVYAKPGVKPLKYDVYMPKGGRTRC